MKRIFLIAALSLGYFLVAAVPGRAQQRPLVTQDPEVVGPGQILVDAGFDYGRDWVFPASGLKGDLFRFPTLGTSVGIGPAVEIQVSGGLHDRLSIGSRQEAPLSSSLNLSGDTATDFSDLFVATKIRLLSEAPGRPALGVRIATKLPMAGSDTGLGLGTTDFYASFLGAKTIESIRVVGNIGIGFLGNPVHGDRQDRVLTYGASVARALTDAVEVVGELNGRLNSRGADAAPGTESRSVARIGARYTFGPARIDGGILVGLTSRDPSFGITAGITYVFKAFSMQ